MKSAVIIAVSGLALLAGPALAAKPAQGAVGDTVVKVDTDLFGSLLDEHNVQYEVATDDYGDPTIHVTVSKTLPAEQMSVVFYECDDTSKQCEDAMLWSWYKFGNQNDAQGNLGKINAWNKDHRWSRAYVDEDGDAVLEMDLNATGGVGVDNLGVMVATYVSAVTEFEKAVK